MTKQINKTGWVALTLALAMPLGACSAEDERGAGRGFAPVVPGTGSGLPDLDDSGDADSDAEGGEGSSSAGLDEGAADEGSGDSDSGSNGGSGGEGDEGGLDSDGDSDGGDEAGGWPGDSDGGDSSDPSGSGGEPANNCGEDQLVVEFKPAHVMLVLDKSGSMAQNYFDHDNDPSTAAVTRWAGLHGVVEDLLGNFEEAVNFGVALFPAADAGAGQGCKISGEAEIVSELENRESILASIPGANADVQGGTPATAGIRNARKHLESIEGEATRAMILVTDGAANCKAGTAPPVFPWEPNLQNELYDSDLGDEVQSAWEDSNIATYVVGIDIQDAVQAAPKVNPHESLNDIASRGGAPRESSESAYYNTKDGEGLTDALQAITDRIDCFLELNKEPPFPSYTSVEIDGVEIPEVDSCESGEGWRWVNPEDNHRQIELCSESCQDMRETKVLDATFGCPPVE